MKSFLKTNFKYSIKKHTLTSPLGGYGVLIFIFPFLLTSCIETLDIDTNDVNPKIVLNGIIEADSSITVSISKTYPFTNDYYENHGYGNSESTDTIVPNFLPEAKPIIYINDVLMGEMIFQKNDESFSNNGSVFHSEIRPKVGDKVRIEVSAQGFETVWTETIIPKPIQINQVDTNTFISENKWGYVSGYIVPEDAKSLNMALGISIENPNKDKDGFYAIEVYQEWIQYYNDKKYARFYKKNLELNTSREPLFSENTEDEVLSFFLEARNAPYMVYFTDEQFVNKKYKLNLSVWGYYFHQEYASRTDYHYDPLIIHILSMSPEMYRATNNSYSEMDNVMYLFSEPEITFTNVHNGVGVLGSCSSTKTRVIIPKYEGEY